MGISTFSSKKYLYIEYVFQTAHMTSSRYGKITLHAIKKIHMYTTGALVVTGHWLGSSALENNSV